jgi:antitoxin VapB
MALNIKNEEVHRLVEELARATGESQTAAVRHAVQEKLERINGERARKFERIMAIAREAAAEIKEPFKSMTHEEIDDMLYDEMGLPK